MAENTEFVLAVPFGSGATPVDVTMQDPPGGPHKVEIVDVKHVTNEKNGKVSLRVSVSIKEGEAQGISTMVVIGTDFSKPFNVSHLANLLIGAGVPPDKLKGNVNIKRENLVGKTAYIFVKAPMEGEIDEETGKAKRANNNFITKAAFDAAVRSQQIAKGDAPAAAPVAAKAAPKAAAKAAPAAAPAASPEPAAEADGTDLESVFG